MQKLKQMQILKLKQQIQSIDVNFSETMMQIKEMELENEESNLRIQNNHESLQEKLLLLQ